MKFTEAKLEKAFTELYVRKVNSLNMMNRYEPK